MLGREKAMGERLKELKVPQLAAATRMEASAGLNTAPAVVINNSSVQPALTNLCLEEDYRGHFLFFIFE
jgi:hypothetical protein